MRQTWGLILLCLALSGCTTRWTHRGTTDVVILVRMASDGEAFAPLPDPLRDAGTVSTWHNVNLPAPGLPGAFSFFSTTPSRTPLAPAPESAPPPSGWTRRWLRWPTELASAPEELRWAFIADQKRDHYARRVLHLAVFEAATFEREGEAWLSAIPPQLHPSHTPWVVINLPTFSYSTTFFDNDKVADSWPVASVQWVGVSGNRMDIDEPIDADEIPRSIPDFARGNLAPSFPFAPTPRIYRWADDDHGGIFWSLGEELVIARSNSPLFLSNPPDASHTAIKEEFWRTQLGTPLDLWVFVRAGTEIEFVDVEIRIPGGIESRRALQLEEIDTLAENGPSIQKLLLAVGEGGDGAVYELVDQPPNLWIAAPGALNAAGTLGVPFYAGPSGQSLGLSELSLATLNRNFYRCLSAAPPTAEAMSEVAPGVHLWLVPRESSD